MYWRRWFTVCWKLSASVPTSSFVLLESSTDRSPSAICRAATLSSLSGRTILRVMRDVITTASAETITVNTPIWKIRLFFAASISAVGAVMASRMPLLRLQSAICFSTPRHV